MVEAKLIQADTSRKHDAQLHAYKAVKLNSSEAQQILNIIEKHITQGEVHKLIVIAYTR